MRKLENWEGLEHKIVEKGNDWFIWNTNCI